MTKKKTSSQKEKKTKIVCESIFGTQNFMELYTLYIRKKIST